MKTSELIDETLDWAVAIAEGAYVPSIHVDADGTRYVNYGGMFPEWSTDWAHGGPIIEREGISLYLDTNNLWQANIFDGNPAVFGTGVEGSTPLIAAMRCYVASKLGDEVKLPEELT